MAFFQDLAFRIQCNLPDGYTVWEQSMYAAEVWTIGPHRRRIALATIWRDDPYNTSTLCVVCGDAQMEWKFRTVPPVGEAVAWLIALSRL